MINSSFMKTLDSFKEMMLSKEVPNYIRRYCQQLNDIKWVWFYIEMLDALMITDNLEYLFYVLKWILKHEFHDLTYEMYFYDMINPEGRSESLISDCYWSLFNDYYYEKFARDLSISH